jgi:protoporphyrinogen oxidase
VGARGAVVMSMESALYSTRYLIVGAGVSGLAAANFLGSDDYLVLERDAEVGGYCKTVYQDGFIWDYSGHFFHFKRPDIEAFLRQRMPSDEVQTIAKRSSIYYKGGLIDFPFQKNIHQLPQAEFIECLYDLYFKSEAHPSAPKNFKEMVCARFGDGIAQRFLIPYNEKLYACDLASLDPNAMGRFFPMADTRDIIRNFRQPDNASYNSTFTYPKGGAIRYVEALLRDLDPQKVWCGCPLQGVDLRRKVAQTPRGEVAFEHLISSAPLGALLDLCALPHDRATWRSNKVLVFNLGFDRKGWRALHWVYFPDPATCFYRIGFYDNIFDTDRMSLYVEVGLTSEAAPDVDATLTQVLEDLRRVGVVEGHQLVSWHSVTLDPAYVHITTESQAAAARWRQVLGARGVYSIGRYGGWTYCSIEDNIIEAQQLADVLKALP